MRGRAALAFEQMVGRDLFRVGEHERVERRELHAGTPCCPVLRAKVACGERYRGNRRGPLRKARYIFGALVACALVAAACGDNSSSSTTTTTRAAGTAT